MARCAVGSFTTGLDESPLVLVGAGPLELSDFFIYNNDSAAGFVQFFDAAAIGDVTLNSTVPDFVVGIAATSWAQGYMARPRMFGKGLVIGFATTATGNGATSSTAEVSLGISKG